ncbi:MAG: SsrA-binding protein SmpB [Candidatus Omnitrophica bacterium]|nr:SsrA-binding protein SmpB [Candidatus Omnitrophota bacterium]MCB9747547.1 SsrA-binding protein SmpB [Candidatus Omnitrophota bacterium]
MSQVIATNKKAFRDYFLSNKWECGIALKGGEVKSIRAGKVNFKDSFARIEKEEVYLYNLHIDPYLQSGHQSEEPDRVRKLLLNKKEIKKIVSYSAEKHLNIIPTKIYFNARGYAKVEIALGKGKKMFDKRESIKKRSIDRSIQRTLRSRR